MTHIIVPRTHPLQYYGIRMLILILTVSLLWGAFEWGYMQSEEDIIASKGGRSSLIVQQKILKKQNKELSKELLHLDRKYLLEQEACQIVKSNMSKDLQKIAKLEKELAFYKAIVSPAKEKNKGSLYLQSMEIIPHSTNKKQLDTEQSSQSKMKKNLYRYKFIVAQKIKKRSYSSGSVKVYIKGKKGKNIVRFSMISLLDPSSEEGKRIKDSKEKIFKYNFKYFQEFSGIINLPEGMIPQSVDVIIDSKKKKSIIELSDLAWSKTGGMKYVGQ